MLSETVLTHLASYATATYHVEPTCILIQPVHRIAPTLACFSQGRIEQRVHEETIPPYQLPCRWGSQRYQFAFTQGRVNVCDEPYARPGPNI